LGVAPWELAEQPLWWEQKALLYMKAEAQAQKNIQERNKPKGGK
jgi:hypothetical protein